MNIDAVFEKTHLLPTIPRVVQELIDSFNQEDIEIGSIAKRVAVDQVLTAKVLRLANSAHYGSTRQIGSVDDAVVVLGFNSLRTLVIASGITGAFSQMPGFDRDRFWQHSLHVASIAKWLARHGTMKLNGEIAFTAGLMHGIGQLLLHIVLPKESATLQKTSNIGTPAARVELEQATMGIDHCEVGTELARRWNFPDDIQRAIAHYARPEQLKPMHPYAALIHLAVFLATLLENDGGEEEVAEGFPAEAAAPFSFTPEMLCAALPELKELSTAMDSLI